MPKAKDKMKGADNNRQQWTYQETMTLLEHWVAESVQTKLKGSHRTKEIFDKIVKDIRVSSTK